MLYVPCGDVCGMGLRVFYIGEVVSGCKSCDWGGVFDYFLYELLSNKWVVVFMCLFIDGFTNGDFLVDIIVDECCWGGCVVYGVWLVVMGVCVCGGGHVMVCCVIG